MAHLPQALTIASSDPGGGAGIQADIKAMHANRAYALSVVVALTAQNTKTVTMIHTPPVEFIRAQLDALFDDFEISATKTGMLYNVEIVGAIARELRRRNVKNLVIDPVMISKSGDILLKPDAVEKMKTDLFPLAAVVTPNIQEAEVLSGRSISTIDDVRAAAREIRKFGCGNVLVKGGHLKDNPAADLLDDGREATVIPGEFISTPHTHGTGCTYSAAIAAQLANGKPLPEAVAAAKRYTTEAIRHGLSIGHGHGPTDHFYFLRGNS